MTSHTTSTGEDMALDTGRFVSDDRAGGLRPEPLAESQPKALIANAVGLPYHDLGPWANDLMASRKPDFIIGADYIHRWWVIPRNKQANVYLHRIMHSDDDRALHDHPWANTSVVLSGRYLEHTPDGSIMREAGDVIVRQATDAHRLEILPGEECVSLFMTGPTVREWGFHCPQGWRLWTEFVDARDSGQIGRGCD